MLNKVYINFVIYSLCLLIGCVSSESSEIKVYNIATDIHCNDEHKSSIPVTLSHCHIWRNRMNQLGHSYVECRSATHNGRKTWGCSPSWININYRDNTYVFKGKINIAYNKDGPNSLSAIVQFPNNNIQSKWETFGWICTCLFIGCMIYYYCLSNQDMNDPYHNTSNTNWYDGFFSGFLVANIYNNSDDWGSSDSWGSSDNWDSSDSWGPPSGGTDWHYD